MDPLIRPTCKLSGLNEAVANLNGKIRRGKVVTKSGITRAVLFVERESKLQVPVGETGNLKSSWHSNVYDTFQGPVGEMGYSAVYAVRQHEEITWRHKVGKAKFLEDPIKDNTETICEIMVSEGKKL